MRKAVGGTTLIYAPTIELVNASTYNRTAIMRFFDDIKVDPKTYNYESQPEVSFEQSITEFAARMCYQSWDKGRPHREHIHHLTSVGHLSVFEHNVFTFALAGISRSLTHELVRHRHMSFSQLSQRYVDHTYWNLGFVVPPDLIEWFKENPLAEEEWAENRFKELLEYKASLANTRGSELHIKRRRQAARNCLPNCMETRMVVSGNARTWLEACLKRRPPGTTMENSPADLEIWRLFDRIKHILQSSYFPDMFKHFYEN